LGRYLLHRILSMIPVLFGMTLFIFVVLHLAPGDPALEMLGAAAPPEAIEKLRNELGLNDPLYLQFFRYIGNVLRGDFGMSYSSRAPVLDALLSRYPVTLTLASVSTLIMVIIGLPIGIISATRQYSILDRLPTAVALMGVSMPTFWIGMLLILIFGLHLRLLPVSGFSTPIHWILPAFAIGFNAAAICMRMTRSTVLEVIRQDFIRTARAKGQTERRVLVHHALKNALIPILTVVGIQLGRNLGGSIVTETVFSIPGLGYYMLQSILARDYPVVQGGVIFIAATFSLVNLGVDLLYALVDPRIRSQYQAMSKKKNKGGAAA
jgi:peptide/nickel transport system permease protein